MSVVPARSRIAARPAAAVSSGSSAPGGAALALSDFFLCLARAWLPPPQTLPGPEWCKALAEDLEDLSCELGLDAGAAIEALRDQATVSGERDAWLVVYSRLFLVPPVPITLNTGLYLEGALGGNASQMMHACYRAVGFERDANFRDLPDHVAMQLEFVAALYGRAVRGDPEAMAQACEFLATFVDCWAEPLRKACERAEARHPEARVFAGLTSALESSLRELVR